MFGYGRAGFLPRRPRWHLWADSCALTFHRATHTDRSAAHTADSKLTSRYWLISGVFLSGSASCPRPAGITHPALPFQVTFPQELLRPFIALSAGALGRRGPALFALDAALRNVTGNMRPSRGKALESSPHCAQNCGTFCRVVATKNAE